MIAAPDIASLTDTLVHQSVIGDPVERGRHQTFITHHLAVSFAALAFAPFFLAYRGAPTIAESLAYAFVLLPLVAAVLVGRTGRLAAGQALIVCGLLGFAATLSLGPLANPGASIAWLIVAQWEASLSPDRRLGWAAAAASFAVLALMVCGADAVLSPTAAAPALAVAYVVTAICGLRPRTLAAGTGAKADRDSALLEAIGGPVILFDTHGLVDDASGNCEALVGLRVTDLLGRGLFQIVHVGDRPQFLKLIADAADGQETMTATIRFKAQKETAGRDEPRFIWVEMRAKGLRHDATPQGVVAVLRDVTAIRQHDLEIADARQSAETAIRSKGDFLTNMSHELRTPLNAIIGFSEMLGSRTLCPVETEKQREYARIIHQSGQHLLSVVNSILDMSKLQSGTFAILPEPFDLRPLVDQCCDIVKLKAQEGRVVLRHEPAPTLGEIVGDRRACKQILINLLSNAVKFTPEGGEVNVSVKPDGTAVLIAVSDTGIGIGADDLAHLGDPFFQARSSLSRPFEGTGLGLSVVRGLVGLHGGTMIVESEPAKGTRVTVRLPVDCQTISTRTASATIETIPRRLPSDIASRPHDTRMKAFA